MPHNGRPRLWIGALAATAAVGATTLAVYPLREVAAPISLSVVYLLAVLLIASVWGAWLGFATALASALAFNFLHIPPTGRFTIADGENWVALAVFLIAAVAAGALADAARSRAAEADERRREANLAAEMSRTLLRGDDLRAALPAAAQLLATSLALASAAIELQPVERDERRLAFPLRDGSRQLGALLLSQGAPDATLRRVQERIVPALEALLAAALERVFAPFHRSGDERTGHRGSGLGLAIARGFVEVNGGRVWAESLPGQGTSFVVELALEAVPATAPAPAS